MNQFYFTLIKLTNFQNTYFVPFIFGCFCCCWLNFYIPPATTDKKNIERITSVFIFDLIFLYLFTRYLGNEAKWRLCSVFYTTHPHLSKALTWFSLVFSSLLTHFLATSHRVCLSVCTWKFCLCKQVIHILFSLSVPVTKNK